VLGLALALAALIGVSLGLLGSGGSIVTLPVLVYVARVPAHQAVGMSLVIVGATSAMGSQTAAPGRQCIPLRCLVTGIAVGLLTGFLGVGGGFVILPALVFFAGLEMKVAIGTSLAVIAVNSFAGLAGQLHYVQFDWPITLGFLGVALAGMVCGVAAASRISSESLGRAFAGTIIALGGFLLVKNLLG
jgi:uncharacterized protein